MKIDSPLSEITGVGDVLSAKFKRLGVKTVADLLDFYPRRYEDYSLVTPIVDLRPGKVSLKAHIKQAKGRYVRRGMHITEAIASDETGSVRLIWFNQPYRAQSIRSNEEYFISGDFQLSRQKFSIINPSMELASDFPINTARILPVYKETEGLKSNQIRKVTSSFVASTKLPETLPSKTIKEHELVSRQQAITKLHRPTSTEDIQTARRRLGFEEVFELVTASLLNKRENKLHKSIKVTIDLELAKKFTSELPFKLTDAQRKTVWQIYKDMESSEPMNRLIEGDVGSGKTVAATMAALMVMAENKQVALMAPTEILARQHAETIFKLLAPLGRADEVVLLVGSLSKKQKDTAHTAINSGKAKFIVGTHALIQDKVDMHNLALVIIDEQHRFGVEQRKKLMAKAGHMPHILSLSATPIPRSLALTLYGELDISVLDQKPIGRKPIHTEILKPGQANELYEQLKAKLKAGEQMFIVCPQISDNTETKTKAVEQVYEETKKIFKEFKVGLIHGKLKSEEKQNAMQIFINNNYQILVATTVIEVGVDVPNANVMLIHSPEMFGLAQLHQLRGRVGRSDKQGFCYLLLDDNNEPSRRLRALKSSNDGFKLADLDLEIRGPGALYGQMQHGQLDLRIAQLTDTKLIAEARQAAKEFLDSNDKIDNYPHLNIRVKELRKVTNLN